MNRKIFLVDLKNDNVGHYHIMKALSAIKNSEELDTQEKKFHKDTPFKMIRERIRIINSVADMTKTGCGVIHFLTADKFYFLPFVFRNKFKGYRLIATIHRFPQNPVLLRLLKLFAAKVDTIVVFSGYMEEHMRRIGIKNVRTILHPAFYDCSALDSQTIRDKYNIKDTDVVFSIMGGTRIDKGIEVALDAFKYITDDIKKNMILNIAGKEKQISRHTIMQKANQAKIRILDNIRYLSTDDFKDNIAITDYMLCPYTKAFQGVSGPMCEAFGNGKPCILPSQGALGWFAEKEGTGFSFQIETPQSLAHCLTRIMQCRPAISHKFSEKFKLEYFIKEHEKLYCQYD